MRRLRDSPDDRFALVGAAADHFGLADPAFVEKDFWVVELLRSLVAPLAIEPIDGKQGRAQVVFKGGTSLSKAFAIIERFSEDVDILVVCSDNLGAGAREKRVLRPLCDRVAADMAFAPDQIGRGSYKTGFTRNVTYLYPAAYPSNALSEGVFLEMGIRGGTQPGTLTRPVRSFIADYLESTGDGESFDECEAVEVDVLHPVRTLAEKLALIHHAATVADATGDDTLLLRGGRHYYDIHQLLHNDTVIAELDVTTMADLAADVDAKSEQYGWGFTHRPDGGYAESIAFAADGRVAEVAAAAYDAARSLIYGPVPTFFECLDAPRSGPAL